MVKRRKQVKRAKGPGDRPLPTPREVEFVRLIACYLHYPLPSDFARSLEYVRTFLDTFAYSKTGPVTKDDVHRRCHVARLLAYEDRPLEDYVAKLGVTPTQAELLRDFGRRKIPSHWANDATDETRTEPGAPVTAPERPLEDLFAELPESVDGASTPGMKSTMAA